MLSTQKIRLLHIIPALGSGGAERLVIDICSQLSNNEEIELLLVTFSNANSYKEISSGIKLLSCNVKLNLKISGKSEIDVSELNKIIEDFKPQIIHAHLTEADLIVHQNRLPGIIYITNPHSNKAFYAKPNFKKLFSKNEIVRIILRSRLIRKHKKHGHYYLTNAVNVFNYYKKNLNIKEPYIKNLFHATDLSRFKPPIVLQEAKPIKLITVGALNENKNQMFLLKAVKKISDWGHPIHLTVIGTGNELPNLEQYVKDNQLDSNITFAGHVKSIEEMYWSSSIYVHASKQEGFGLVFSESMACGLPCIAIDNIGNREIIRNGINGYIVKSGDIVDFCNKIIEVSNNDTLYKKLQSAAIETSKKFDIVNYVAQLKTIYKEIIGTTAQQ
jgi:glycosyltransferase involved in cell wall biosynthesis